MLRLGIIGCGGIAAAHGKAAQQIKDLRFVAACDVRRAAAADWAATYGAEAVYDDYREMLKAEALDGVLLATWPNQHREQIEVCLAAGIRNILCEKALTMTGAQAGEIWHLACRSGALVMEGFMYRHHPAIRRLEQMIFAGEIGRVDNIRAEFGWDNGPLEMDAPPALEKRNWRLRSDCGGGVPFDAACYAVNAAGHFARACPSRVYATGTMSKSLGVIMRLFGLIEYRNGVTGIISPSHGQQFSQELQVEGTRGHLFVPVAWTIAGEGTVEHRCAPTWGQVAATRHNVPATDSYAAQLRNFAAAARKEAAPLVPLVESVVNTHVIAALIESQRTRQPVDVELPPEIAAAYDATLQEAL